MRRLLLALVVASMVVVAGCSGGSSDTDTPTPTTGVDGVTATPGDGTGTVTPGDGTGTVTPGDGTGTVTPGDGTGTATPGDGQPPGVGDGEVNSTAISAAHNSLLRGSSFQVNVSVEGGENPIAFTLSNGTSAARIDIREADGDGVARFYVSPDYVTRFNNTQSPPKTYSYGSTGTQFRVAFTYAILLRAYPSQQLNLGTFEENGTVTRNGEELTRLSATGINQTAVEESGAFSNANLTDMSGEVLVRSDGLVREMNLQQSFENGQTQNLSFSLTGLGSTSADAPGWIGEAPRLEGSLSANGTVMELAHTGGPEIPAGTNLTLSSGTLAPTNVTLPESVSSGDSVYVYAIGDVVNPTVEVSVNDPPSPSDAIDLSQYSPQVSGTLGEVRFVIGVPSEDGDA
ncbi:MAG: hypothetical protein ABEH88_09835 [Halobacteriales archaeon]